ncbi:MAG: OmpA family protein, partial [Ferruginibacter sp.]
MASKKYKLLLGLLTLVASSAFSQVDTGRGGFYDSSVIPQKRQPQQNEFMNNVYDFPSKPRNMWEVGVSLGAMTESSDVAAVFPTFGWGVHVRKALGYLFSLRAEYINGYAKGLNWTPATGWGKNPAWTKTGYGTNDYVYYNYKAHIQDLSVEGIITLNNVRFHKEKTGIVIYGGGGIGLTIYKTMINALDANGHPYSALFDSLAIGTTSPTTTYSNRKSILNALKAGMDNTYETPAESEAGRHPKLGDNVLKPSGTVIVGIAYKLSDRINIALEDRQTFVKTDLLDGQQWQDNDHAHPAQTRDFDSYNYASLGINFNLGSKSVQPLWWVNPLDYAYSEINNPRHMRLPKPVFDDDDNDGVVNQLDKEPNTPAGCPVDTHGVTKDTDGDGVPDCKDKELITPTECQPVDADGVGKCPAPACCDSNRALIDSLFKRPAVASCPSDYPSVSFKGASIGLSADAKGLLASVAAKLKANPTCTITLTAYPRTDKPNQSLAQARLDTVKKYLVEKLNITTDRIETAKVIGGGDEKTIDIK